MTKPAGESPKRVNLALQGGGAHGAFTWGVLDCLLEDNRLAFDGISGTSAGAMNAVVMADGMVRGGREGGREALERFWRAISTFSPPGFTGPNPADLMMKAWGFDRASGFAFAEAISRMVSPYDFNPININPLKQMIEREIDFERVHFCNEFKLFVSATNVHTGKARVFAGPEITADVVMASACLPYLFHAVEIDGVPYWDGGFMGNPVLFPFFYECASEDILLVQVNPIERKETPRTAHDIQNRINEITFNSSLLKELRAIAFVRRLIEEGRLERGAYKRVLVHRIDGDAYLAPLTAATKLDADWSFLQRLKESGRIATKQWLDSHFDAVGNESTVDLDAMFGD